MKEKETEQIAKLWFEDMWSKPDLSVADKIVDPAYNPSWIQIEKIGPAQIKHEIKHFRMIFPDLNYEILEMKGEEDKVWVRVKVAGTNTGEFRGEAPTGKKFKYTDVHNFRIVNNKIIEDIMVSSHS